MWAGSGSAAAQQRQKRPNQARSLIKTWRASVSFSNLTPPSRSLSRPGLGKGDSERGMAQFQEMMRQQLESSMHSELEKLLNTATGPEREVRWLTLCSHTLPVSPAIWL